MKNRKQTTTILASAILMLSIFCQSVPVSAATKKIILNDVNGDGEVSIGDTFCLGEECFYVTKNANSQVQALVNELQNGFSGVGEIQFACGIYID